MEAHEIESLLINTGAVKQGNFRLSNGNCTHEWYIPCKAFQFPPTCRKLAFEIVKHFWDVDPQVIIAARVGAIPFAAEIARQLEARFVWRSSFEEVLYPNLELHSGDRIVLVDDIVTDDISIYKPIAREILSVDARLIGLASLIDVTTKKTSLNVRQITVLKKEITELAYSEDSIDIPKRP